MLLQHDHPVGVFDPGLCRLCARHAGLLDHHRRVQEERAHLQRLEREARRAGTQAALALWASGLAVLLATIVLLQG